ncbi:glycosyltransferase family 4 protein [Roseimaritima sediminicola]|uniref:glycosyltransferase family 4 protein n=1 Tax=Roseimaritima sediminicola TaxID=2662066 RepID=UPI0012983F98|nr:glycosyltransferase family 4 protein [Roseimaritima sediminicola]
MGVLRTLLVTRRFWPHVGDDAACRLAALAEGFRRSGAHPHIVAARYAASWPKALVVRETQLSRPAPAPRSDWSMSRYTRALSNWLRDQAAGYDLIYADAMREEGAVAVETARRVGVASVVRYGGVGRRSDHAWSLGSRNARRWFSICLKADRIIATRASAEQRLLAAGVGQDRIVRIDNGFLPTAPPDNAHRQAARRVLSQVNSDLFVPVDGQVLLSTNQMLPGTGLDALARALPPLLERHPKLRVWLVGDGQLREELYDYLRGMGVRSQVAMPGCFASLDEVLAAADAYVLPGDEDGLEYYFPRVLGAGVPAAVVDTVETRRLLGEDFASLPSFAAEDHPAMLGALERLLATPQQTLAQARLVRQRVLQHSFQHSVEKHLRLFCQLTGKTLAGTPKTAEPLP